MSRQQVALILGTVLVGGMAVYLFLEVRETPPAVASVTKASEPIAQVDEPEKSDAPSKESSKKLRTPWTAAAQTPTKDDTKSDIAPSSSKTPAPTLEDEQRADPKADAILDEVNKTYDHGEYDEAKTMALKILAKDPTNVRMLRVAVSSACILGDQADAQKYYSQLTQPRDREQMKTRCARYQVTFTD